MNGFSERGLDESSFSAAPGGISVSTFDAFPKTKKTYLTKSHNGGVWTVAVMAFCAWLTVTEFWRWMAGTTTHTFSVEKGIAHDLQMNLDIVIAMPCDDLHVNVQDASGDRVLAGEKLTKDGTRWESWSAGLVMDPRTGLKTRKDANPAGAGWATEQLTQYTKDEDVHEYLRKARERRKWSATPRLKRGEVPNACRIFGSVEGNKVQGDFHITARGHGYMEWGQQHLDHKTFNFSHHINEMSFGPFFPSITQPLDNAHMITPYHFYKYQYYLSIVPTIYTDKADKMTSTSPPHIAARNTAELRRRQQFAKSQQKLERQAQGQGQGQQAKGGDAQAPDAHARDQNVMAPSEPDHATHSTGGAGLYNPFAFGPHTIYTNQYAVTEQSHKVSEHAAPGLFFKYDIEPVLLTVAEEWGGVLGLLVRCVNVVAGVMVAGGWLASLSEWGADVAGKRRARSGSVGGLLHGQSEKRGLE